jgi:glutathione S-transferase
MMIVHHLNNSRSQRVLWMLEEVGAEYEIVRYRRDPSTMLAPPELQAVHPLGKSPVIEDDGQVFAETGAIVEHLAERFGALMPPPGSAERRRATYWLHFSEGSAMPPLLLKLYFSRMGEGAAPMVARADQQIGAMLTFVDSSLIETPFLAGESLSVADIMMSFPLEAAVARGGARAFPQVMEYLGRLHARPAYARALERGGPYELLT